MMDRQTSHWKETGADLIRGMNSALFFGIPFLYTMEMWWIGTYAELWKLLALLALAFIINLQLAYFSGTRRGSFMNTLGILSAQALEATAIGAVASVLILLVLNRIHPSDPLDANLGKIMSQIVPLSLGAAVVSAVFARKGIEGTSRTPRRAGLAHPALDYIGATVSGSLFIGFPLAPTTEIPMLAATLAPVHLLSLIVLSLILSYTIVYHSEFSAPGWDVIGPFRKPIAESMAAYIISLIVAFIALFLFDRISLSDPLFSVLAQTLVLGLPSTIGGAAGRLVV